MGNIVTKLEFLAAFKTACDTLPGELLDAALADYERQFTDQILSGLTEQVIVERWGSPQHAALKLKLGTFNGNLKQAVSVEKVARVGMSGVGLAFMDFFLLIPATIYSAVLLAFYLASLLVYLSGIFISASSLAQVSYIDVPVHYFLNDTSLKGSTHLNLGNIEIVSADISKDDDESKKASPDPEHPTKHFGHFLRDQGFHIATHISKYSVWKGIGTTLAGMLMLTFCFLATRFTFRILKQFASWHFTVLKNA
jgi:uncharacterized membrane protein